MGQDRDQAELDCKWDLVRGAAAPQLWGPANRGRMRPRVSTAVPGWCWCGEWMAL